MKTNIIFIIGVLVIIGAVAINTAMEENDSITINYAEKPTLHNMNYCTQEEGYSIRFSNEPWIKQNNLDVTGIDEYHRLWIRRGQSYHHTDPLKIDCSGYDYTAMDNYVQAVLDNKQYLYVSFVNSPYCFIKDKISDPWANTSGDSRMLLPDNYTLIANHWANIVKHMYDSCKDGTYRNCRDFNKWKFAIGNEPFVEARNGKYAQLYLLTYDAIKKQVPEAVVGTGWLGTLQRFEDFYARIPKEKRPVFIEAHWYDDASTTDPRYPRFNNKTFDEFMDGTEDLYKKEIDTFINGVHRIDGSVLVYNFEYNIDWAYLNKTGNSSVLSVMPLQQTAAWWVSSMYWQLQTDVRGECWFTGTGDIFGMWHLNKTKKPTYYAVSNFVKIFKKGDNLHFARTSDGKIEAIANDKGIVIVNKRNETRDLQINFKGKAIYYLVNNNITIISPNGKSIKLKPYETAFYTYR